MADMANAPKPNLSDTTGTSEEKKDPGKVYFANTPDCKQHLMLLDSFARDERGLRIEQRARYLADNHCLGQNLATSKDYFVAKFFGRTPTGACEAKAAEFIETYRETQKSPENSDELKLRKAATDFATTCANENQLINGRNIHDQLVVHSVLRSIDRSPLYRAQEVVDNIRMFVKGLFS